jgi:hypothetical protein
VSKLIEVYDPPMCCSTGVCGPSPDPKLIAFHETVLRLEAEGVTVKRYMLTAQPAEFMKQPEVVALMRSPEGTGALPVTIVEGKVFRKGAYPKYEELKAAAD